MNNLDTTAEKFRKLCKVLCLTLLGATIVRGLGLALQFILFVSGAAKNAANTLRIGFMELHLTADFLPTRETATVQFICSTAMLIVGVIVSVLLICLIAKILKPAMAGQPFNGAVSGNLKKIAWVELIGGLINGVLQFISYGAITRGFDLSALFSGDAVDQIRCKASVDTSFIFIALLLFLLASIFRYGEELQVQADETL